MIWSFPKRRHWRCCWQRQGTTTAYSPSPCHSWYLHWVPTHLHMRLAEKVIKVSTILIRWDWTMMVVELIYYLAVPENAVAVLGYGYEMTRPIDYYICNQWRKPPGRMDCPYFSHGRYQEILKSRGMCLRLLYRLRLSTHPFWLTTRLLVTGNLIPISYIKTPCYPWQKKRKKKRRSRENLNLPKLIPLKIEDSTTQPAARFSRRSSLKGI